MPITSRPPRSFDDALVVQGSTLGRQALRALKLARAADRRDARALVCIRYEGDVHGCTNPETQVGYDERVALAELTVASLHSMCRRALQMVREDYASYGAIALKPRISHETSKERLTAAQRRLRAVLVDAGVTAPPVPFASPRHVTSEVNEVPPQRANPAADRQDSAA